MGIALRRSARASSRIEVGVGRLKAGCPPTAPCAVSSTPSAALSVRASNARGNLPNHSGHFVYAGHGSQLTSRRLSPSAHRLLHIEHMFDIVGYGIARDVMSQDIGDSSASGHR